jgi:signal transduction histidine kinase
MNNSVYFLTTKLKFPSPLVGEGRTPEAAGDGGNTSGLVPPPSSSPTGGEENTLDPKILKHLNIIESEIGKSNTIIRDVLDFSRSRALKLSAQKVDELVEKAIERIQFPPNVGHKQDLQLGEIQVPLDEDEIRQVLVNLMENACQAMTSGGTLVVGTRAYNSSSPAGSGGGAMDPRQGHSGMTAEEWVEITIADTGCGIPQEHLNKIFAPFFTTKSRGTGLGLAVVKKIIERHQGTISVQSKIGEGTAFHIRLPLRGPHV